MGAQADGPAAGATVSPVAPTDDRRSAARSLRRNVKRRREAGVKQV